MTRHMGLGLHVLSKWFFNNQKMCVLARMDCADLPGSNFLSYAAQAVRHNDRVCNVRRGETGLLCKTLCSISRCSSLLVLGDLCI